MPLLLERAAGEDSLRRPLGEMLQIRRIGSLDVDDSGLGVSGRAAPVSAAPVARSYDCALFFAGRREQAEVPGRADDLFEVRPLLRIDVGINVVGGECLTGKRRRFCREWLGGPGLFAGDVALRDGPLFDGP